MYKLKINFLFPTLLFILMALVYSCGNDANETDDLYSESISETDQAALLFMLEEEKLARDTYVYLENIWSLNQFANIKLSEQSHMNAVENLLKINDIPYTILPAGEFANDVLQNFYNQFAN